MTRHIRDKLIDEGGEYYLNEENLEYLLDDFPDNRPEFKGVATALWRSYVAPFEVKGSELIINSIDWLSFRPGFSPDRFLYEDFVKYIQEYTGNHL